MAFTSLQNFFPVDFAITSTLTFLTSSSFRLRSSNLNLRDTLRHIILSCPSKDVDTLPHHTSYHSLDGNTSAHFFLGITRTHSRYITLKTSLFSHTGITHASTNSQNFTGERTEEIVALTFECTLIRETCRCDV